MSNPYPKPVPGSYREPLVAGLRRGGLHTHAEEVSRGGLKLALRSTITGNVRTLPELAGMFADALASGGTVCGASVCARGVVSQFIAPVAAS